MPHTSWLKFKSIQFRLWTAFASAMMWKPIKHTYTPLKLCSTLSNTTPHNSQTPCRSIFFESFGFLPKVIIGTYHHHSNCEKLPSFLLNRLGIEGDKFHITPCRFTRTILNHSFQLLKSSELWRSSLISEASVPPQPPSSQTYEGGEASSTRLGI